MRNELLLIVSLIVLYGSVLLFYRLFLFFYLLQAEDVNLHFFPRVLSVGGPQL